MGTATHAAERHGEVVSLAVIKTENPIMIRRVVVLYVTLAFALSFDAQAQARPSFSGTWQVRSTDPPNYNGGPGGWGAPKQTIVVQQNAATLTIVGPGIGDGVNLVYKLDGTDTISEAEGASSTGVKAMVKWRTRARWEGNRLILYTWNTALNQERDVLSLTGNTLTITRDTESPPPNPPTATLVYTKTQ